MEILHYKNADIHFSSHGKGRVVVLLHGFLENLTMWDDIIPELASKYRVIAIDLLGHGKTENIGYIHSMEDQALMVKAVLDSLNLYRYVMIGHSMGGYVGLAFSQLFLSNVKGLCLMNSTPLTDSPEKKINRDRAIEAVKQNHKTFVRMSVPNLFASYNLIKYKDEVSVVVEQALQMQAQGIIASLEGMKLRKNQVLALKKLSVPTQIIIGQNDGAIDIESTLQSVENTSTEIVIFPDGHMSHIENKSALTETLQLFIRKCYR
ncbi:MAG: alpha/beta fold hydrolase [Flavobacteriaceae bacterium]|nr:alpha/beta fold hydrolase [Flavobacteriaceae bacterium]